MTAVADYSFSRPQTSLLKAAGFVGVVRYLTGAGKAIGPAEWNELRQSGLALAVVYEAGATDALGGASQGLLDGERANLAADQLGFPKDRPIYYAVDFDDRGTSGSLGLIHDYLTAAQSKGREARVYGSIRVVDMWGRPGWQTAAWSNGDISSHAVLWQHEFGVNVAGGDIDVNEARAADWGQTPYVPPAPPQPIPPVVRIPGVTVDITSLPLDANGNGQVAVPGVDPNKVTALTLVGLHDPSTPVVGYVKIPRFALDTHTGSAEIAVEDGVPGGRYVFRVTTG